MRSSWMLPARWSTPVVLGGVRTGLGFSDSRRQSGSSGHHRAELFPADFPVTSQAYQKLFAGSQDCFVTMLSDDGANLVFSTFLGGSDLDSCSGIALSPSERSRWQARLDPPTFPVLGSFQSRNAGFLDGFVVQMSGTGSTIAQLFLISGVSARINCPLSPWIAMATSMWPAPPALRPISRAPPPV